jgi:serine protease Do
MRRSAFITLLVILAAFGIYRYVTLTHGPIFGGTNRYTPAEGPKINPKDVQVLAALDAEYSTIVATVMPSVVSVTSERRVRLPQAVDPFSYLFGGRRAQQPRESVQTSLGSGVIVSREGHILTNHHVIKSMNKVEVQLTDGRIEPAQIIGSDPVTDIAVLKISAANLEPLPLGDSDAVRVGQMVFAVGNPFGLSETVTQGIVSAKGRRAFADSAVEFLQTDAAVNQGNSGGPLLNLRGEIIGINSAIYSETGGWLGISFAIPANVARRALESVIKHGRVLRGYLGVAMANLTPELAQQLGVAATTGALITDVVDGSPAAKAGLKPRDIVRKFAGHRVSDILSLRNRIAEVDVGATVEIVVLRDGRELTLQAQIAEAPADFTFIRPVPQTP